jgi:hypothetical protein
VIPQSYLVRAQFGPARHPCCKSYWWTPERDAKMLFVMEVYDDVAKAARVLGLPSGQGGWIIGRLKKYRNGRANLPEAHAKEVERRFNELLRAHQTGQPA